MLWVGWIIIFMSFGSETVSLKGRALTYAGFPVDNAVVSFRVSLREEIPICARGR